VVPAEPADLSLDATLLVGTLDAGIAVEAVDREMRPERRPAVAFHPAPGAAQHLADRGAQVVIADLAARHAAQHFQRVDVAFQERFLPARSEDLEATRRGPNDHEPATV
jgi:hypothetical protein